MKLSFRKIAYAFPLICIGAPFAAPDLGYGKDVVGSLAHAIADPLSVLAARSPGARGNTHLLSTKPGHRTIATPMRQEFLSPLASMRGPAGTVPPGLADAPMPAFLPPVEIYFAQVEMPIEQAKGGLGGGGGIVPGRDPGPSGPGGGDGATPSLGVPEPSSWIMIITGFLCLGATLRARSTRAKA